jgi:hypothetical protein
MNLITLLSSPAVTAQKLRWLKPLKNLQSGRL